MGMTMHTVSHDEHLTASIISSVCVVSLNVSAFPCALPRHCYLNVFELYSPDSICHLPPGSGSVLYNLGTINFSVITVGTHPKSKSSDTSCDGYF